MGSFDPVLELAGVSRRFGGREVLARLDLAVEPGRVLGLLGPNGAGKTTLLSIAGCVLAPTQGQVTVMGERVSDTATARRARGCVGFLPQNPSWVPAFTCRETVEYAAWLKAVPRRQRKQRAEEALEQVGMGAQRSLRMRSLSGGMAQRVSLAAALVGRPRLLLLDEPTVGLDPAQRIEFRRLASSLEGTAVVLSTHLVEDVRSVADSVLVLHQGRQRMHGSLRDLEAAAQPDVPGDSLLEKGYMSVAGGGGA